VRPRLLVTTAIALAWSSSALGGFSVTTSSTPSISLTLNGSDQTRTYTVDLQVDNSDSGSTLAGWNLTILSTRFRIGNTTKMLSGEASSITGVTSACSQGVTCGSDPSNSVNYPVRVPVGSTSTKFFNAAANTGVGTFAVTPTVRVTVPANAYAGTYSSTLTITLTVGP
jgi:hypothetical protein